MDRIALALAVPLAFALAAASPASGLTIDDFELGGFTESFFAPGNATDEQTVASGVLGDVRRRSLLSGVGGAHMFAYLVPSAADDGVIAGNNGGSGYGSFGLSYDGIDDDLFSALGGALSLDLSGYSAISLDVTSLIGTPTVLISLYDSVVAETAGAFPLVGGINHLSLASFTTVDLTDIRTLAISLQFGDFEQAKVLHIEAVPEPGGLLALGLAALTAARLIRGRRVGLRAAQAP